MTVSAKTGFAGTHHFVVGSTVYATNPYPTSDMSGTKRMSLTPFAEAPSTGPSGVFFNNGSGYKKYKIRVNADGTLVYVALGEAHRVRVYDATYGSIALEISMITTGYWALTNVWNSTFGDYFWPVTDNSEVTTSEMDGHYYSNDALPEDASNILASIAAGSATSPRICVSIPRNNP